MSDGRTPHERRFGVPFKGPVIPFGAMVEYHPISAKDISRLHQFGPEVLPGTFLAYALHAVGIWKGDMLVADIEELEKMDASEIHAKTLNAKEVSTPMNGDNFIFPIADGTVNVSGGDQRLRTSTLIQARPDRVCFVLETIRTGAMRVIHIPVKTEETQRLRIKFVLYCPFCALNLKIKRANFCRKKNCQMFNAHSQGLTISNHC